MNLNNFTSWYTSDTLKNIIVTWFIYFTSTNRCILSKECRIDNFFNERYTICIQADHSSLLNHKLVNFDTKSNNKHLGSEDTLINLSHPYFNVLLNLKDFMIQDLMVYHTVYYVILKY